MLSEPNDANMKSSDSGGLDCFLNYLSVLHEPSSWHDLLGLIFSEKTGKPAPPSYTCQDLLVFFHTFPSYICLFWLTICFPYVHHHHLSVNFPTESWAIAVGGADVKF